MIENIQIREGTLIEKLKFQIREGTSIENIQIREGTSIENIQIREGTFIEKILILNSGGELYRKNNIFNFGRGLL